LLPCSRLTSNSSLTYRTCITTGDSRTWNAVYVSGWNTCSRE